MIVLSASFDLNPADHMQLVALVRPFAAAVRSERGCLQFRFSWDAEVPHRLHLFECWADQIALDEHFATLRLRDFLDNFGALAKDNVRRERFEVVRAGTFQPPLRPTSNDKGHFHQAEKGEKDNV